jgi:hypothetical protein
VPAKQLNDRRRDGQVPASRQFQRKPGLFADVGEDSSKRSQRRLRFSPIVTEFRQSSPILAVPAGSCCGCGRGSSFRLLAVSVAGWWLLVSSWCFCAPLLLAADCHRLPDTTECHNSCHKMLQMPQLMPQNATKCYKWH